MVPQTYLLNLVNNRIEISFSVLSLGVGGWVVAEPMWWWLRSLCGGGCGAYVVVVAEPMWWVKVEIKAISAQPTELELD